MKILVTCLGLLISSLAESQDVFTIESKGLSPNACTTTINQSTAGELYSKSLRWIGDHQEMYNLSITDRTMDQALTFTSTKWNAVNLGDSYFHAKYHISLRFDEGSYSFKPTNIQLKINSKYDMGWKKVDLTDGTEYYKRGKIQKKYRAYLQDLTAMLNELYAELTESLQLL